MHSALKDMTTRWVLSTLKPAIVPASFAACNLLAISERQTYSVLLNIFSCMLSGGSADRFQRIYVCWHVSWQEDVYEWLCNQLFQRVRTFSGSSRFSVICFVPKRGELDPTPDTQSPQSGKM